MDTAGQNAPRPRNVLSRLGFVGHGERRLVVAAVVGLLLATETAHAYIDPGSAAFVITTLLGGIAAAGYVIRGWLGTVRRWVRRIAGKEPLPGDGAEDDSADESGDGDGAQAAADTDREHDDPR